MNYKKILLAIFIAINIGSFAQSAGSCIEIEGILINACSAEEGLNEQVLFSTANTPLTLSNLQISWPNITNTWQGVCQDANTAALVEEMRANLGTCGTLLEPVNGVIPANQQVLLFSGIAPTVAGLSLVGLSDTLYVIFHCGTTTTGNFANSGANPRTLTLGVIGNESCTDTVTYIPNQAPSQNGAAALFNNAGVPNYSVVGCGFFTTPLSTTWSAPGSICSSAEPIDLAALVTGNAGGTFSGNGVTGTFFNPAGLNGNIVITYQVGSGSCIEESQQTINVLQGEDPSWTSPGSLCNASDPIVLSTLVTGTAGGTWSGSGVAGTVFFPEGLNGPVEITYSVGSGLCASQLAQTITLISSVGAPVVPTSVTFCQGQVANPINAGISPGASVTWYSDAALSNIIFEGNGFVPPANISATYYVTQNVAACASTASSIAVAFSPAPSAPTTQSSIVFCQGQAIPELSATATGTITWYNDAGLTQVLGTGATYQPDNNVGTDIFVQTVEGNCASEAVEITLTEALPVTADIAFEGNTTTCNFQPTVLTSPASIGNLWSTGETTQAITISQAGNYTLTVAGTCNTANDEVTFIDNGVEASFTLTDNEGLAPFTATAVVTSSNADNSIFYLNGNAGSVTDNLPFTIQNEGSYTLSLVSTNAAGCVDSSSRVITVISGLLEVSIPNSFTPNGDGYNDLFKPVLKGLEEMNLIIFNRYGSQVASWKEGLINWDGSYSGAPSPDGVYFYVLQGKDYSGTDIERAGSITIVR